MLTKQLALKLIDKSLKIEDERQAFYTNRFTGTCFDMTTGGRNLYVNIKGSNDWKDWARNFVQLINIAITVYLSFRFHPSFAFLLIPSILLHWGFFALGVEVVSKVIKEVDLKKFDKIYWTGTSLGGAGAKWCYLISRFLRVPSAFCLSIGSPKIVPIFNPICWRKWRNVYHIVNPNDTVPKMPPKLFFFFKDIGTEIVLTPFGKGLKGAHLLPKYRSAIEKRGLK